jgi:hypothetical protein
LPRRCKRSAGSRRADDRARRSPSGRREQLHDQTGDRLLVCVGSAALAVDCIGSSTNGSTYASPVRAVRVASYRRDAMKPRCAGLVVTSSRRYHPGGRRRSGRHHSRPGVHQGYTRLSSAVVCSRAEGCVSTRFAACTTTGDDWAQRRSISRNEGVPGSSPGVGSVKSTCNMATFLSRSVRWHSSKRSPRVHAGARSVVKS